MSKIIYHIHHIVPKHAGGTNDSSNLIKLTIEEHAEAHKILWEQHGKKQDYIAWQTLSGNITKEEARIMAVSAALKNVPKSKPPGIGIDIQGREKDKYKFRITGARNKEQLDNIVSFMKILIYLYIDTYLFKYIFFKVI